MDSPLLPTIRGGPRDLDESFADISIDSARSPNPPPTRSTQTTQLGSIGGSSIFGRPQPTRFLDETPDPPRALHSAGIVATSGSSTAGINGGRQKPRQSIFPPVGSSSKSSSTPASLLDSKGTDSRYPLTQSGSSNIGDRVAEPNQDQEELEGDMTILASSGDGEDGQQGAGVEVTDGLTVGERVQRDEKLKDSLYELRGMNDTFEVFLNALESARGHNEVCQYFLHLSVHDCFPLWG